MKCKSCGSSINQRMEICKYCKSFNADYRPSRPEPQIIQETIQTQTMPARPSVSPMTTCHRNNRKSVIFLVAITVLTLTVWGVTYAFTNNTLKTPTNLYVNTQSQQLTWTSINNTDQYLIEVSWVDTIYGTTTATTNAIAVGELLSLRPTAFGFISVRVKAQDTTGKYKDSRWSQSTTITMGI